MEEQTQGPAESVEVQPVAQQPLTPHRGTAILVLGIVGLVVGLFGSSCCAIFGIAGCVCGIIAWVMANKDLKEMAAGRMDPTGRGTTQAGKICGIISVVLAIVIFFLTLLFFGFVGLSHFVQQSQSM
ncbi:MAG: CCC motif membrane protein [Planctomycetota bacterium]